MLTASHGVWTSLDTLSYSYQWQRCDSSGANCVDIAGETHREYRAGRADVGSTISVAGTAIDQSDRQTTAFASRNPRLSLRLRLRPTRRCPRSRAPRQTGPDPEDDQRLLVVSRQVTYSYHWQQCSSTGTGCANITGATHDDYKPTSADVGHEITVVVTASRPRTRLPQRAPDQSDPSQSERDFASALVYDRQRTPGAH